VQALTVIHGRPRATLAFVAIVTGFAAVLASNVTFQNAIDVWFVEDDPALTIYEEYTRHFAAGETIVVALDAEVFSESTYSTIERLAEQLRDTPHVHRVISVLDFDLDPAHDLDDWDTELPIDWTSRRQTAAKNNLVTPTFVSADGLTTGLIIVAEQSATSVVDYCVLGSTGCIQRSL